MSTRLHVYTNIMIIGILLLLVIPIPPCILDILFACNLALSLITLLLTVYITNIVNYTSFPSLVLILTLFRLGLNIASTRLILSTGNAGNIIRTFGSFLTDDNICVGLIIFMLLSFINYVVITKGANRVAEVAARFYLEALPGKQMAIDSDISQGILHSHEAQHARHEIHVKAEFYGAMDGAAKFVKGDAVIGMIILFIDLIGGMILGCWFHHFSLRESLQTYAILTIGDGLVSQIPSLILATATGILVTRSSNENLGNTLSSQLFQKPELLLWSALFLLILGCIPGMPLLSLTAVAIGCCCIWIFSPRPSSQDIPHTPITCILQTKNHLVLTQWNQMLHQLEQEIGIPLHYSILYQKNLPKNHMSIVFKGTPRLEGPVDTVLPQVRNMMIQEAYTLLTRQDVVTMIDRASKRHPAVIEELFAKKMSYGQFYKILQNLLKEQIPIRDFTTLLEKSADILLYCKQVDIDMITDKLRTALSGVIPPMLLSHQHYILTVDPHVESLIEVSCSLKEGKELWNLKPPLRHAIIHKIQETHHRYPTAILVTSPVTRMLWKKLLLHEHLECPIFSHRELYPLDRFQVVDEIQSDILI